MKVSEIKALSVNQGYDLTGKRKTELINQFLRQQEEKDDR